MSVQTTTITTTSTNTALPAEWYRSPALHELEKRAIFSKEWLLITHKNRFEKPGDYHTYDVAGFPFFLIMDRQKTIRGFHNVCRHRAFPVIRPDAPRSGTKSILACYYHGWSYGLNGKLAKAPKYENVEGFEKDENNLFPIHVRIDDRGIVWINLDAADTPRIPWETHLKGCDERPRLAKFNMDDYVYDHTWVMEGNYNWKAAADNYNECYHCPTTHPLFTVTTNLDKYRGEYKGAELLYFMEDKPGQNTHNFAPSWFYPNAAFNISDVFWYLLRSIPTGPTTVRNEYEVYRHKDATDAEFKKMDEFFKQVEREDKELCNGAQVNLNVGRYTAGQLEPKGEEGVLYFQNMVRQALKSHRDEEVKLGREIWPTRPAAAQSDDIQFCESLGSCGMAKETSW
ncbi:hypothetical protein PV08_00084 [Exophiala spinifera]|uniref:Choline monooxygenase, chloroplastic n=1 Tax=Exophiala spinifera TaxID=91928 RepID=A0A0D2A3V0_9EURO|nr:uncharacterized protein PV08_00084 [Exophiala spinifera]KIW19512.1 hypothetical protein PV08_00084 [Exophiala spinifera]